MGGCNKKMPLLMVDKKNYEEENKISFVDVNDMLNFLYGKEFYEQLNNISSMKPVGVNIIEGNRNIGCAQIKETKTLEYFTIPYSEKNTVRDYLKLEYNGYHTFIFTHKQIEFIMPYLKMFKMNNTLQSRKNLYEGTINRKYYKGVYNNGAI